MTTPVFLARFAALATAVWRASIRSGSAMTAGTRVATERRAGPCWAMAARPLARRSQRTESSASSMSARASSRSRSSSAAELAQRVVIARREGGRESGRIGHHVAEPLDLDVEVAHGTEDGGEPTQLLAEGLGPHGQHVREEGEGGPQAPRGHPHVVQLLDVLAEPGPRLLVAQHGELAPEHGVGQLADGRLPADGGRAQIGRARDVLAEGEQPGLELREAGGLEPAGGPQLVHDRLERAEPVRLDLDLDPAQLHGSLSVADDDDGVIERDLGRVDSADAQGEGPPARPHLEHLAQGMGADDGPQAPAHRALDAETARARRGQDLGDLEALAQPVALGRARVLEGDFVVAAAPARAHHEAGPRDAPVGRVEVRVGQPAWRPGQRGHRAAVVGLDGECGQRGQPPLDGAQVERIELPLDFDRVVRSPLSFPGSRHRVEATATRPVRPRATRSGCIATNGDRGDGKVRVRGATGDDS